MKHLLPVLVLACVPVAVSRAAPAGAGEGKRQADPVVDAKLRERALALRAKLEPALSPATRRWLAQEARKLTVDPDKADVLADLRTQAKNPDFAHLSVEDAMLLMLAAVSEDARKDTKALLAEMEATRKKRDALREASAGMKKEEAKARTDARRPSVAPAKVEPAQPGQPKPGAPGAGASASPRTTTVQKAADQDALLEQTRRMQEAEMGLDLRYLQLQSQMQAETRAYRAVSNIMETKHDTVKNSISNVR